MKPLLLLALAGCAIGPQSGPTTISPVAHRGIRALIGATVTLGAQEVGVSPMASLLAGTVGQVAVAKGIVAIRHPEWIGKHTPGDFLCDTIWSSAVAPLMVAKRVSWKAGLLTAFGWGAAAWAIQRRCIP